jgi:hypothetical protein
VELFCGDEGEVVDRLVGAFGVVPVHPFQGGGFDLVQVSPRPVGADQLGLVQADGVGLEYTIGAVTCVFSYEREVVMRRSGTGGLVRRGLVSGGSGARRG